MLNRLYTTMAHVRIQLGAFSAFGVLVLFTSLTMFSAKPGFSCEFSTMVLRPSANSQVLNLKQNSACDLQSLELIFSKFVPGTKVELGPAANGAGLRLIYDGPDARLHITSATSRSFSDGTLLIISDAGPDGAFTDEARSDLEAAALNFYGARGEFISPVNSSSRGEIISSSSGKVLPLSSSGSPATQHLCGDSIPAGWVTVAITSPCLIGPGTTTTGRTIENIQAFAPGAKLDICGQDAPAGWASIAVKSQYCAQAGISSYIGRTIERIDGFASGTKFSICGGGPPPGWVSVAVGNKYCAQVGTTSFIASTIERIDGSSSGTSVAICGGTAPFGWVTTEIKSQYCANIGNAFYIGRTIKRIDSLPVGTSLKICGDSIPPSWAEVANSRNICAVLGFVGYDGLTIKKL